MSKAAPLPPANPAILANMAGSAAAGATAGNLFDWLWIFWLVAFPVVEGFALYFDHKYMTSDKNKNGVDDDGFSLSAHVRLWMRVDTRGGRSAFLAAFGGFAVWFIFHIVLKGVA